MSKTVDVLNDTNEEAFIWMPIDDIKVGKHRKDLDIAALAKSIAGPSGLLHPITVDANGNLLAGARRLAACKQLGWTKIPVRRVRT
jgi:ParB-like chromosome segregation protein Spo0J